MTTSKPVLSKAEEAEAARRIGAASVKTINRFGETLVAMQRVPRDMPDMRAFTGRCRQ